MAEPAQMEIEEVAPVQKPKGRKAELVKVEKPAKTEVVTHGSDTSAIFSMVEKLMVDPNVSVEKANQALDFALKLKTEQARMAFDEAVSNAKAEIKPIARNATGHNNKKYADFSAIAREVDPILGKHGLSYRFRSGQEGNQISITCRLAHKGGHFEETTLFGPADTSGSKNAIQAIGSTTSYLQRYTLVLMLGLAASNDDDGNASGDPFAVISDEQADELTKLIDETATEIGAFLQFAKAESMSDVLAIHYPRLKAMLMKKKGAKR